MSEERVVAYIDGGARGNPGPAGYGVRVEAGDGSVIEELNGAIGVTTNNVAEYQGLLAALAYLDEHGYHDVLIRSDSELLTKQMLGQFRVRHPRLQPLYEQAQTLVARLGQVRFERVPRAENTAADRLANAAMDSAGAQDQKNRDHPPTGQSPPSRQRRPPRAAGTVLATGIDIESIARIDQMLQRYGDRFLRRVFTDDEVAYSLRRRFPAQHLAGRFAAKEAAMKALGTGRARGVLWRDVEVVRVSGPPQLRFHGGASRHSDAMGAKDSLLTITHSGDVALAQVLLLGR